jgi:hypothetical protein
MARAFEIPDEIARVDFPAEYRELRNAGRVNAVNHGEFEMATTQLIQQAEIKDKGSERSSAIAIQRCRRGGKTFMLHAVLAQLSKHAELQEDTRIVFISMNSTSQYTPTEEDAYTAILSRIAWELSDRKRSMADKRVLLILEGATTTSGMSQPGLHTNPGP